MSNLRFSLEFGSLTNGIQVQKLEVGVLLLGAVIPPKAWNCSSHMTGTFVCFSCIALHWESWDAYACTQFL